MTEANIQARVKFVMGSGLAVNRGKYKHMELRRQVVFWIGCILRRNCVLYDAIDGEMTEVTEVKK